MELKFVDGESSPQQSNSVSFDIWDNEKQSHIGYAEGYLSRDLIAVINLFDRYRNIGLGKTVFLRILDSLGGQGVIQGLVGSWHSGGEFNHLEKNRSTNLLVFQERLQKGDSQIDAASATPTGKWAANLGYTEIKILSVSEEEVSVLFTKPK